MLEFEKYLIPVMESTYYPIDDINNWMKPLLSKTLSDDDFNSKMYEIRSVKYDLCHEVFSKLKKLADDTKSMKNPDKDWVNIIKSEIIKFVKVCLNTDYCKKYYGILTQYSKVDFMVSSNPKHDTILSITHPYINQYYIMSKQWEEKNLDALVTKFGNDRASRLVKELNPFLPPDWFRLLDDVIYKFAKKRFANWPNDMEILASGQSPSGKMCIMFNQTIKATLSADEKKAMYNSFINDFVETMRKNNIRAGNNTYKISNNQEDEPDISYVSYSEYSGSGGDYDNGLSKENKIENQKFIKILYNTINDLKKKYPRVKVDNDDYRGFGSIYIDIY